MSTVAGYVLAAGEYAHLGVAPHHRTGVLAACLARLLCVWAIASILWAPQLAGEPYRGARGLAAGVVGLLTLLVMLHTDVGLVGGGREGREASVGWTAHARSRGTLVLLVTGTLWAVALTGGWGGPLAALTLLPALTLDSMLGSYAVLGLAGAILVAGVAAAFFPQTPAAQATWSAHHLYATVLSSVAWAVFAALIFWLRMLLARLRPAAIAAEPTRKMYLGAECLAQAAHELLTPLAAIQTGAGLLAATADTVADAATTPARDGHGMEQAAARRVAANVWRNAARLTLLMEDVLELARWNEAPPRLTMDWQPCAATIARVVDAVALLCDSRSQRVVCAVTPPDLCFWGDDRRVEQLLVNLVANAHRYAGDGATITLAANAWEFGVRWEVCDDGPGLDERALTRVVDPAYRTAVHVRRHDGPCDPADEVIPADEGIGDHPGHGLGLAIAAALVGLHLGSLWAENNAVRGCRFVVWLPGYRNALSGAVGDQACGHVAAGARDEREETDS